MSITEDQIAYLRSMKFPSREDRRLLELFDELSTLRASLAESEARREEAEKQLNAEWVKIADLTETISQQKDVIGGLELKREEAEKGGEKSFLDALRLATELEASEKQCAQLREALQAIEAGEHIDCPECLKLMEAALSSTQIGEWVRKLEHETAVELRDMAGSVLDGVIARLKADLAARDAVIRQQNEALELTKKQTFPYEDQLCISSALAAAKQFIKEPQQ